MNLLQSSFTSVVSVCAITSSFRRFCIFLTLLSSPPPHVCLPIQSFVLSIALAVLLKRICSLLNQMEMWPYLFDICLPGEVTQRSLLTLQNSWISKQTRKVIDARYVTLEFYFPHYRNCRPPHPPHHPYFKEKTGRNVNCVASNSIYQQKRELRT